MSLTKWAFLYAPENTGVFNFFRILRPALAKSGIDLRWVAASRTKWTISVTACNNNAEGEFVGDQRDSDKNKAFKLVKFLNRNGFKGVIVNIGGGVTLENNLVRYLPPHLARIAVVHITSFETTRTIAALSTYVHQIIAISPRISDDAKATLSIERRAKVSIIPHGVPEDAFAVEARKKINDGIRLLMLGRVQNDQKGVFDLPKLLDMLEVQTAVTVAGEGPDRPELERRLTSHSDRVSILGWVGHDRAMDLCGDHDVLYFPSRYEGFGFVLIEAMARGCVPVASLLPGVTDFIVEDGVTGYLVAPGDVDDAAAKIKELGESPQRLEELSVAAQRSVYEQFHINDMAAGYARTMSEVGGGRGHIAEPLDLQTWCYPRSRTKLLRRIVPERVKSRLRAARASSNLLMKFVR